MDEEEINIDVTDEDLEPSVFERLSKRDIQEIKIRLEDTERISETVHDIIGESALKMLGIEGLDFSVEIRKGEEGQPLRDMVAEVEFAIKDIISKSASLKQKLADDFRGLVKDTLEESSILPPELTEFYYDVREREDLRRMLDDLKMIHGVKTLRKFRKDPELKLVVERTEELDKILADYKAKSIDRGPGVYGRSTVESLLFHNIYHSSLTYTLNILIYNILN